MKMPIEPILDIPVHQLRIRVEDTILGPEILSTGLPKALEPLISLIRR